MEVSSRAIILFLVLMLDYRNLAALVSARNMKPMPNRLVYAIVIQE